MTGYDRILGALESAVGPDVDGEYMVVFVQDGDADVSTTIINEYGGTVTGINEHEAGCSITFEL